MKKTNILIALFLIIGGFVIGRFSIEKPQIYFDSVRQSILQDEETAYVLLDSTVVMKQLDMLSLDSCKVKFMMYEMQRQPMTSYFMVECMRRNGILNEEFYLETRSNMFKHCCL